MEDSELVNLSQAGNPESFGVLCMRHHRLLSGSLRQRTSFSYQEIEGILQDTYLKAWSNINSYRGDSKFVTWLFRIAKNRSIDIYRKNKPESFISENSVIVEDGGKEILLRYTFTSSDRNPEDELLNLENRCYVREAISRLDDNAREIIYKRAIEDKSYREIARELNIPEGTVMSRLFYARKKLRNELVLLGSEKIDLVREVSDNQEDIEPNSIDEIPELKQEFIGILGPEGLDGLEKLTVDQRDALLLHDIYSWDMDSVMECFDADEEYILEKLTEARTVLEPELRNYKENKK
jgi:RNA polymerase sigma-70 factor (ECF subfamily)